MRRLRLPTICQISILLSLSLPILAETDEGSGQQTIADRFLLQQRYGSACMEVTTDELDKGACVHQDPNDPDKCYPRNRAVLANCVSDRPGQQWYFDFGGKQVHNNAYPESMCLSRMVDSVELWPCISGIPGQVWTFDQAGLLTSKVDFEGRGSYLHFLKGDSPIIHPLQFKYVYPGQWDCYRSPIDGELQCDKQSFGDNVIWKPEPAPDPEPTLEPKPVPVEWGAKPKDLYWMSGRITGDLKIIARETSYCLGLDMPEECQTGELRGESCYARASVEMRHCSGGGDRIWRYDVGKKRLFNKLAGYTYCLTWLKGKLSLNSCFAGGGKVQNWYFARGRNEVPFGFKRLRYITPRKQYDFQSGLEAPDLPAWQDFELEYQLQPRTAPDQACGVHPVYGTPMAQCP